MFTLENQVAQNNDLMRAGLKDAIDGSIAFRMAAHERLSKVALNLNTLGLTAWVAVVGWKFENFEVGKNFVYLAVSLHVGSLIGYAITDMLIMLHSKYVEEFAIKLQGEWELKHKPLLQALSDIRRGHTAPQNALPGGISYFRTDDELEKIYREKYRELYNEVFANKSARDSNALIRKWNNGIWGFGVTSFGVFIAAILITVFTVPRYIQAHRAALTVESAHQTLPTLGPSPQARDGGL